MSVSDREAITQSTTKPNHCDASSQVRALSVLSMDRLLSASRDASAKRWHRINDSNEWQEAEHFADAQGKFVSAVSVVDHEGHSEINRPPNTPDNHS